MLKHIIRKQSGGTHEVNLNALRAIRAQCLECLDWNLNHVRDCTSPLCSLFPFRFGKDPSKIKRTLSEDRKKAVIEILAKSRLKRGV